MVLFTFANIHKSLQSAAYTQGRPLQHSNKIAQKSKSHPRK